MKKPTIKNLIKHNENIAEKYYPSMLGNSLAADYYKAKGWIEALNYITNNYKLEEK